MSSRTVLCVRDDRGKMKMTKLIGGVLFVVGACTALYIALKAAEAVQRPKFLTVVHMGHAR